VVDPVRVHRLLRAVTDDLARLECEAAADDTHRSDPMWLRGVKYTFVTAIEGCVDLAQHGNRGDARVSGRPRKPDFTPR